VTAGLAEIVAGAISMGVGGFLAARSEVDHYEKEYRRELEETTTVPREERAEVALVFRSFGFSGELLDRLVEAIISDRTRWVEFMMRFELGLERPDVRRAPISAATIAVSYMVGGIVPLAPYMLASSVGSALGWSVGATLLALLIFGAFRARFGGRPQIVGALQTMLTGGFAAGAAFGLAKLVAH
jgi:VIT1/CCC1 family predicted Fe2+/Mn2+ transporter